MIGRFVQEVPRRVESPGCDELTQVALGPAEAEVDDTGAVSIEESVAGPVRVGEREESHSLNSTHVNYIA